MDLILSDEEGASRLYKVSQSSNPKRFFAAKYVSLAELWHAKHWKSAEQTTENY